MGFSSPLLIKFCVLTLWFVAAIVFLQLEVYWQGRVGNFDVRVSVYHDILLLANEVHVLLSAESLTWREMSERDLNTAVSARPMSIDVAELPLSKSEQSRLRQKNAVSARDETMDVRTTQALIQVRQQR